MLKLNYDVKSIQHCRSCAVYFSSTRGPESSVLCGEGQTGPETEGHPGRGRGGSRQNGNGTTRKWICVFLCEPKCLSTFIRWSEMKSFVSSVFVFTKCHLGLIQLGQAVTKNPGYLKLRRIRAAQNIAKTVRPALCLLCILLCQHHPAMVMMIVKAASVLRWRHLRTRSTWMLTVWSWTSKTRPFLTSRYNANNGEHTDLLYCPPPSNNWMHDWIVVSSLYKN